MYFLCTYNRKNSINGKEIISIFKTTYFLNNISENFCRKSNMTLFYNVILFLVCLKVWSAEEIYTRVENQDNLFVGTNHTKKCFQKISIFFVNDSSLSCSNRYLQILFNVLTDKNQEVAATGFLTETGGITNIQEAQTCVLIKKYFFGIYFVFLIKFFE